MLFHDTVSLSIAALGPRVSRSLLVQPTVLDLYQVQLQIPYMQTGTIAGLTDKGFGFIKYEGAEKDLFFHSQGLVDVAFDDLKVGDAVSFEVEQAEKGPRAINVRLVA